MRELNEIETTMVSGGCAFGHSHGPLFYTLSAAEQAEICAELNGQPNGSFHISGIGNGPAGPGGNAPHGATRVDGRTPR
ncbi:hypothetical protein [Fretibacter rubidus]|uniref:hypothetical protein n=1 Tax=Fretibacter rubidus TaxID=570162 RepID=UPI00352B00ED